jgi:ATP-dependent exoDNAse (exonuclease V) alpha subunit
MSELSWLLDLLLNHGLEEKTKKHVAKRIAWVEKELNGGHKPKPIKPIKAPDGSIQSPSTIAAMERHLAEPTQPIAVTAQTQAALISRQSAIEIAMSGKPEKGRTSPRKF